MAVFENNAAESNFPFPYAIMGGNNALTCLIEVIVATGSL